MNLKKELTDHEIKKKTGAFIKDNFFLEAEVSSLSDDDSFFEKGIIDSTGVLELVSFLEETFKIRIEDEELIPNNLDSLNKVTAYVKRKTNVN